MFMRGSLGLPTSFPRKIPNIKTEHHAPFSINPARGGGGMRARGGDLMPETIPPVGLLIMRSDPGVWTFDFDQQKPGINSEAVTKSVP